MNVYKITAYSLLVALDKSNAPKGNLISLDEQVKAEGLDSVIEKYFNQESDGAVYYITAVEPKISHKVKRWKASTPTPSPRIRDFRKVYSIVAQDGTVLKRIDSEENDGLQSSFAYAKKVLADMIDQNPVIIERYNSLSILVSKEVKNNEIYKCTFSPSPKDTPGEFVIIY